MKDARQTLSLKFPTQPQYTHKIFKIIEELLDLVVLEQKKRKEFIIALGEALDNAITHGNKLDKDKFIEVECLVNPEKIICRIKDEGEGFNYKPSLGQHTKEFNPVDLVKQATKGKIGGFGLVLMKKCANEITFNDQGNEISFTVYLFP